MKPYFSPTICRRMDYDKDEKLNFMEFCDHVYEIYKNYVQYETPGVQVSSAEEKFVELDKNKDKYTFSSLDTHGNFFPIFKNNVIA